MTSQKRSHHSLYPHNTPQSFWIHFFNCIFFGDFGGFFGFLDGGNFADLGGGDLRGKKKGRGGRCLDIQKNT